MSKVSEMTREKWIMSTFPEWGTWLVEDIENEVVQPGNVAMWWLGCTGVWFKTPGGANITIDLWCGNGKRTHGNGQMAVGHQMANMCGARAMQPNLRNVPFVIDPFAFKQVDAVLATHYHQDHMSAEWAAHVLQSNMTTTDENGKEIPVPFIGPKKSVETWVKWGVPEERCKTVKPGDVIKIKDLEIVCLDSFDRTCIVTTDSTGPDREELTGKCPTDMDEKAVNYLVKTPGGNIYHSGDSHFSIYFAKHGKDYDIDEKDEKLARLDWTAQERRELVDAMQEVGLPIRSMCLSGHRKYPLGSADPAVRERGMEIMEKAVALADNLGVRIIQLAGYDVYYEGSTAETKALFLENLRKAAEMAAVKGILLGFETMETDFMNTVWKSMFYVNAVGSPYLGVYPDSGNLTNAALTGKASVLEDLKSGRGHIVAMHLKETVPGVFREVPFLTGHVDFEAIIRTAWELGVRRYVTEMWYTGNDDTWKDDIHFACRSMRELLDRQA